MKVEHYGKLPPKDVETPSPPWYCGKRAECPKCGTVVTLGAADGPPGASSFNLFCPLPGCGAYIPVRPVFDRSGLIQ